MHLSTALQHHRRARAAHGATCLCRCAHPLIPWVQRRLQATPTASSEPATLPPFRADHAGATAPIRPSRPLVLTNLRLFDGVQSKLQDGLCLRIEGNRIAAILPVSTAQPDAAVLDCGGRVVMPGLIDAHWHSTLCGITEIQALTADTAFLHIAAAREAERTLLRGFTAVRDAGGPSFALKQSIDAGLVNGPRIYPSGAMVSQTSGHADFRMRYEIPATPDILSYPERAGMTALANGEAQVLQRVREQLMLGASQIKLMAGGGVSSRYDPLESLQFTEAELRAAVAAAADWGTYVMVHVYSAQGMQRAIKAGVKCIEHGQLADEDAVRLMADHGTWWSLQPFLDDEDANAQTDPASQAKQQRVTEGTLRAYELAQRFGIPTAWGTDTLFTPQNLPRQGHMLAKLKQFYAPLDLLRMATGQNGSLLGMAGLRNPYAGAIGTLTPNALADLLVVDGDPSQDLDFLTTPESSLKLIMKDGGIYKQVLGPLNPGTPEGQPQAH